MKKSLFALVAILLLNSSVFSQEVIDLFIWGGQSNALGWRGDAAFYPADPQNLDSQIRLNYTFIANTSSNGWITMQPQDGRFPLGHFGPEVSFARQLKLAGYNPAIFKYTRGGGSIYSEWLAPGAGGHYDDMVTDFNAAVADLVNQGHTVNIRGFIWVQGESDALNSTIASAYENNLSIFINDLRTNVVNDNNLPIILGLDEQHPWIDSDLDVVSAQQNIATNDVNIKFSSMYGFPKADASHLTPAGLISHGERIFDNYQLLTSGQVLSQTCVQSAVGTLVPPDDKVSWGQSFKMDCSGLLSEIQFNSATQVSSPFTVSIHNGPECEANVIHSQNISALVDGVNSVLITSPVYLDTEHSYYLNITSDNNIGWRVRLSVVDQIIGRLRTSLDSGPPLNCDESPPHFEMDFAITIDPNTLSINNNLELDITKIYPNPTHGEITIALNNLKDVALKVIGIKGNVVYSEEHITTNLHRVDLSKIASGIYIVQLNHNGRKTHHKLILK